MTHQKKDDLKKFEKNIGTIVVNVLYAKKEKYILPMFQNITQIVENCSNKAINIIKKNSIKE